MEDKGHNLRGEWKKNIFIGLSKIYQGVMGAKSNTFI